MASLWLNELRAEVDGADVGGTLGGYGHDGVAGVEEDGWDVEMGRDKADDRQKTILRREGEEV